MPFEIDDDRTILIYGVRYSMGFFQALGQSDIGSVFEIVRREDSAITLRKLDNVQGISGQ